MICIDEDSPFIKDNYLVAIVPIVLASCSLCIAFTSCCLQNSPSVLSVASVLWYDSAGVWLRVVIWTQCVVAQSVLIALKLNGISEFKNRAWTYIFIPSYVMMGLSCMLFMTSGALNIIETRENVVLETIRISEMNKGYAVDEVLESTPFLKARRKKAMKYTQEQFEARKMRTMGRCFFGFLEFCCLLVSIPILTTVIYSLQSEEDGHDKIDSVLIILPILIVLGLLCLCCTCVHYVWFSRTK